MLEGAGLVGARSGARVGLVTWTLEPAEAEAEPDMAQAGPGAEAKMAHLAPTAEIRVLAVDRRQRGSGVGRALLAAAEAQLRAEGVRHAWLVTTNDNLAALALYQKAGWRLVGLRAGALDETRRTLKPEIPAFGEHGIPLRDELELRKAL